MVPKILIFIMLFFATRANPLKETSLERQDQTEELALSLIDDIRYPEHVEGKQGVRLDRYPGSKWSNNVIPYTISSTGFTTAQRQRIMDSINALNQKLLGCLTIVPRARQSDYVMVISGNGCYSNLGRTGGQQTLSLQANGCLSNGTIQHEFIHAVGFTHQHNRPDRDDYVKVLYENIPAEWQSQYEKGSRDVFNNYDRYDYYSVMHYPLAAPGTNKPAFAVLDPSINPNLLGQRNGVSDGDIRQIRAMYNCSSIVPPIG